MLSVGSSNSVGERGGRLRHRAAPRCPRQRPPRFTIKTPRAARRHPRRRPMARAPRTRRGRRRCAPLWWSRRIGLGSAVGSAAWRTSSTCGPTTPSHGSAHSRTVHAACAPNVSALKRPSSLLSRSRTWCQCPSTSSGSGSPKLSRRRPSATFGVAAASAALSGAAGGTSTSGGSFGQRRRRIVEQPPCQPALRPVASSAESSHLQLARGPKLRSRLRYSATAIPASCSA